MAPRLKVGDRAPDFTLKSQEGEDVSLHDYLGKSNVVVFFYPKDFTTGCTIETKAFGENYAKLRELGAEVLGISSDSAERHKEFAEECKAGFPLLSDSEGRVRNEYGAGSILSLIPGRVTFVIDKEGVIQLVFSSQMSPKKHVNEAVQALKDIEGRTAGNASANP
jgi:peroxiredoxin Q/BCP